MVQLLNLTISYLASRSFACSLTLHLLTAKIPRSPIYRYHLASTSSVPTRCFPILPRTHTTGALGISIRVDIPRPRPARAFHLLPSLHHAYPKRISLRRYIPLTHLSLHLSLRDTPLVCSNFENLIVHSPLPLFCTDLFSHRRRPRSHLLCLSFTLRVRVLVMANNICHRFLPAVLYPL